MTAHVVDVERIAVVRFVAGYSAIAVEAAVVKIAVACQTDLLAAAVAKNWVDFAAVGTALDFAAGPGETV